MEIIEENCGKFYDAGGKGPGLKEVSELPLGYETKLNLFVELAL